MRRIAIAVGLALVAGCTRAPGTPDRSPESPRIRAAIESAEPTLQPTPLPTAAPTFAPLPSDPELRHTVELRRAMGLRSDLEWIAAVAADPRASTYALAIPLLPEEEADVTARTEEADAVAEVVTAYAASHPEEFGGIYIDHASRAGVVTLWTGHLAEHEAAIRAQLVPGQRVEFRA
ncbi:MAG TPA: hypothetical protein VFW02_11020, partial [Candidatus Limnocylindrales bacterium]|nr:hypothetical protein [Candidatus Limnocylindrales bacterium]